MITLVVCLGLLLGGRPMQWLSFAFTDSVSGKPVHYWRDRLGRYWLASGKWSLFRVETQKRWFD